MEGMRWMGRGVGGTRQAGTWRFQDAGSGRGSSVHDMSTSGKIAREGWFAGLDSRG